MLVLSSKIKYAIAALMELANYNGRGLVQTKVIAERRAIPPHYLEQLLNHLTRAGIVRAVRGSRGGYELALPPEEITFLHVWEIMEGGREIAENGISKSDAVQDLFRAAEEEIKKLFSVSLAELSARQQSLEEKKQEGLMFYV